MIGATTGTVLHLAGDLDLKAACHDNPETLMRRDAGVVATITASGATPLSLTSAALERIGGVLMATGIDPRLAAVGAVHVGEAVASGDAGPERPKN